jgi:hypothetical protein
MIILQEKQGLFIHLNAAIWHKVMLLTFENIGMKAFFPSKSKSILPGKHCARPSFFKD